MSTELCRNENYKSDKIIQKIYTEIYEDCQTLLKDALNNQFAKQFIFDTVKTAVHKELMHYVDDTIETSGYEWLIIKSILQKLEIY